MDPNLVSKAGLDWLASKSKRAQATSALHGSGAPGRVELTSRTRVMNLV